MQPPVVRSRRPALILLVVLTSVVLLLALRARRAQQVDAGIPVRG